MPHEALLGRIAPLTIRRFASPGAFLALDDDDRSAEARVVLLPGAEVPEGAREGDTLEVFIYLDSEDRPVATLRTPKVMLGEVAFLRVTATPAIGAFVDWGLAKELLVPYKEQTRRLVVGERHPIGLYVDSSGRLAGTMRVSELLREKGEFELDEWVVGEAWRKEPGLGVFAIIERSFVGRLPEEEPNTLARGDEARFRVANILPDGRIELSLRGPAHEEIARDAQAICDALGRPDAPKLGDRSSPELIRTAVGLSKKAFKRAVGRLLARRAVTVDDAGFLVLKR